MSDINWEELPLSLWEFAQSIANSIDGEVYVAVITAEADTDVQMYKYSGGGTSFGSGRFQEDFIITLVGAISHMDSERIFARHPDVIGVGGPGRAKVTDVSIEHEGSGSKVVVTGIVINHTEL